MDAKSLELYLEEQRLELKQLNTGIIELTQKTQELIDGYKPPVDEVTVKNSLTVNTEKEVEITNLELLKEWLNDLGGIVKTAIADNSYKPVTNITVDNIKEALPTSLDINNLDDIKKYFDTLALAIKDNQPIVNLTQKEVTFPTSPKQAIAVRLSDGKSFYNAITTAISAATPEVDPLVGYQICERDDTTSTKYYGYAKASGAWYILKESSAGSYRYKKGSKYDTDFASNWAIRDTLDYAYIYEVF